MRHFVTIGITDRQEVITLCTEADQNEHRQVLADLTEKRGQKSQRQRFVLALTLSSDHYIARRSFPVRDVAAGEPSKPEPSKPADAPPAPQDPSSDGETPAAPAPSTPDAASSETDRPPVKKGARK